MASRGRPSGAPAVLSALLFLAGCSAGGEVDRFAVANRCRTVLVDGRPLVRDGDAYRGSKGGAPVPFYLAPADLGTYLLRDPDGGYLVARRDGVLGRETTLESDVTRTDDAYVSGAEWELLVDPRPGLRNRRTGRWLEPAGLGRDGAKRGARITFEPAEGCTEPPELSLDAEGAITRTTFDDGDLYGIVDTHVHLMTNWGFGGGGIFHGAPFHRLGVEHALGDCSRSHGEEGRRDLLGSAFDGGGADGVSLETVVGGLLAGELSEPNHATAGYPHFTEWPDAVRRSTHQMAYHRWLERAHLGGLRLIVQHATTNSVLCTLMSGASDLPLRYSCDDMVAVDRILDETAAMERYLDAQAGGPGRGWFRIVHTPDEARQVIADGKLAVILGIETSNLFDCRLLPRDGGPVCDEAWVIEQLDAYYERGVRAIFPVHKYDNLFSAGDGDRNIVELGNLMNSGHYSNFVTGDCPDLPSAFDHGAVVFGGLNEPRDDYFAPPTNDVSGFEDDPVGTTLTYLSSLAEPALEGDYCQNAGMTELGELLMRELMDRGMIVEIDHMPRRTYERAFEILQDAGYPAVGSHGNTNRGRLYELGGLSKVGIGRCRDPERPGALLGQLRDHLAQIAAAGAYPAEGFGFDLNGFASYRGGRFEPGACPSPQLERIAYPFPSWGGDVTFSEPFVGERRIDFDEEGFVHIGMLPELLEDARRDAGSDAELEPLFRSAEAYLRMWERAIEVSEGR